MREAAVHCRRLASPNRQPRLVIFPCGTRAVGSSHLRAWCLGVELRRLGWRVTIVPPQLELKQRERIVRFERPDLILLQKGRHPLNRPGLYPDGVCVFDLDDADYLDPNQLGQVVECCRGSELVIAGSRRVAKWCSDYNPNTTVIWTGAPSGPRPSVANRDRRRIVAWAHSSPLRYPQEASLVQQTLCKAAASSPGFEFRLYGVGKRSEAEKFLKPIVAAGIAVRTFPYMPYARLLKSLGQVAIGLHPVSREDPYSGGKSFGKVLAYLDQDVAVVTSKANDHAEFIRHGKNGMLVETIDEWCTAIVALLDNPENRSRLVAAAHDDFQRRLTVQVAARLTDQALRAVLTRHTSPQRIDESKPVGRGALD